MFFIDTAFGVWPIGLTPDSYRASSSTKQNEHSRTELKETKYFKREIATKGAGGKPGQRASYDKYQVGIDFSVHAFVKSESTVSVLFEFEQTGFEQTELDVSQADMPPDLFTRSWRNTVSLKGGEPTIVGSTQDEEKAIFLILCAHLEHE